MASTPHDFAVQDDPLASFSQSCDCGALTLRSQEALSQPGGFGVKPASQRNPKRAKRAKRTHGQPQQTGPSPSSSSSSSSAAAADADADAAPVVFAVPGHGSAQCGEFGSREGPLGPSELLDKVLVPVALARGLPIAIKVGAHRGVNPKLGGGGDGIAAGVR